MDEPKAERWAAKDCPGEEARHPPLPQRRPCGGPWAWRAPRLRSHVGGQALRSIWWRVEIDLLPQRVH